MDLGLREQAAAWLFAQGLPARTPAVRSSDYHLCLHNPFVYYLARRLGLVPTLDKDKALNRGTWFHSRLALFDQPDSIAMPILRAKLVARQAQLQVACDAAGRAADTALAIEEQDMLTACAWWEAACTRMPISLSHGSLVDYLTQPCWRVLAREVLLVSCAGQDRPEPLPRIAQLDLLLLNQDLNTLWLYDGKTCSGSPRSRLATCPIEFQTFLYTNVVQDLLNEGLLQAYYGLPASVKLGGMIHGAVQKCELEFGELDRPFIEYEHTLKSGPRKGAVELRREYEGTPSYELYLARQKSWYTATGMYTHRSAELTNDPPVNLSFSWAQNVLSSDGRERYGAMLSLIEHYACEKPWPVRYPIDADGLRGRRDPSPYLPFALMPVHSWPSIATAEGFGHVNRDELLPVPCLTSCILETAP